MVSLKGNVPFTLFIHIYLCSFLNIYCHTGLYLFINFISVRFYNFLLFTGYCFNLLNQKPKKVIYNTKYSLPFCAIHSTK